MDDKTVFLMMVVRSNGSALFVHLSFEYLCRLLAVSMEEEGKISWMGRSVNDIAGTDIHAYWYNRKPLAVHIEATGYALLGLMERERRTNNPRKSRIMKTN